MGLFLTAKTERKQVEALNRCRLPELSGLVELFKTLEDETLRALAKADDSARIYRLQGRAEVFTDFLEAVQQAASVLERAK